jgi:TRAP-type uncharacterized transport system fused permease subunit
MPPVMGAAAFLMVEYVGITYIEVIKHAFLPAIISYIALVYIVHLEACKMGLEGMKKTITRTATQRLLSFVFTILSLIIIAGVTYYGLGWIKEVSGEATIYIVSVLLAVAYMFLLWVACKVPELERTNRASGFVLSSAGCRADVVSDGGKAVSGTVRFLGNGADDRYSADSAAAERFFPQNEGQRVRVQSRD